jgi:hypothetical protein
MNHISPFHRNAAIAISLMVVLVLITTACGCTQPSSQQSKVPEPVTAVQADDNHITIAFHGGPGMDSLVELEVTVTDSTGKSQTQSIGSRLATTPVQIDTTHTLTGSFGGKDHVLVTGYFSDGSKRLVLDTTI